MGVATRGNSTRVNVRIPWGGGGGVPLCYRVYQVKFVLILNAAVVENNREDSKNGNEGSFSFPRRVIPTNEKQKYILKLKNSSTRKEITCYLPLKMFTKITCLLTINNYTYAKR